VDSKYGTEPGWVQGTSQRFNHKSTAGVRGAAEVCKAEGVAELSAGHCHREACLAW